MKQIKTDSIHFAFQSYGVKIAVAASAAALLASIKNRIGEILPNGIELIEAAATEHLFRIETGRNKKITIIKNDEITAAGIADEESLFNALESQIRLTVAEFAVGKVFLHAGVVGWKEKAVVIPATSFSGKSALVAELIKNGALYYSDEYAVVDENGLVSPFPKTLSLRGIADEYKQVEFSAESLGGETGSKPIPIGMVLICRFERTNENPAKFTPEILSAGQGTLEIIAHTIPIRFKPKFTLEILNKITSSAIIARCDRGEARIFARLLLDFLDTAF